MGFRLFSTICLIMIVASLAGALSNLGWVPWALACSAVILALVGMGLVARRRRGTQTALASQPEVVDGQKVVLGQGESEGAPPPQ